MFRFDFETFELGLSSVEAAEGEQVRVYDPARTVVDLMRLRHRLGEPLAHGALRRYLRRRDAQPPYLTCCAWPPRSTYADPSSARSMWSWRVTRPTRQSPAGRAYLDLQNRARREGRGTQQLLTLYVVERWLARLSASPYAEKFVLKGGMLLAAYGARRPTADADALARDIANDQDTVVARIVEVAGRSTTASSS